MQIAQDISLRMYVKKRRRSGLRRGFLACIIGEIAKSRCVSYFSTVPKSPLPIRNITITILKVVQFFLHYILSNIIYNLSIIPNAGSMKCFAKINIFIPILIPKYFATPCTSGIHRIKNFVFQSNKR